MSKGARFTLDQLGPKARAEALAQLGISTPVPALPNQPRALQPMKSTLRQSKTGLNKLETAFLVHLEATYPADDILSQSVTLKLGNGVRYTPDFFCFFKSGPVAWETKGGFFRDDARVKSKVAASMFPQITFYLVQKVKGCWQIEKVLA